jgi:putative PIN family toxin of toxin-antitoxin system
MTPTRLVLDTNVLLSALLFHSGAVSWLRAAWQSEFIVPLTSRATIAEFIQVLRYPEFRLTGNEREDLLADYLPWCETVIVANPIEVPDCRDPFDRPFLELALAASADALIIGDKDLLELGKTFAVPILTPAAFKARVSPS